MRVCFAVEQDQGMESEVYGHFGSAPRFMVVDLATGEALSLENRKGEHEPGGCHPLAGLAADGVEAVVVGGIGRGALQKLHVAGVRVYRAEPGTVAQNLALLREDALPELQAGECGGGHGHGRGHGQGHGCSH